MQLKIYGYIFHCHRSARGNGSRGNVMGIVTSLRPGRFVARDFALLRSFQTVCVAHLMLFGVNERTGPPGLGGRSLKGNTKFHLVPRSRMSGAVLLLPNAIFSWALHRQLYPLFFYMA